MLKAIVNGQIIWGRDLLSDHALLYDRRIVGVVPRNELPGEEISEAIDAAGLVVSPGLIDTHIHGIAGFDTMDGSVDSLRQMSLALVQYGVTAFLPTTMAMAWNIIELALDAISQAMSGGMPGARVIGAHLEGPYISESFRGAQAAECLLPADPARILAHRDVVRLVTYAPELDQGGDFRGQLQASGIVASMGHTEASYEQVRQAIQAGLNHVTHLFNAMPMLHHRHPGPVGAVLEHGISCELIADDLHVHPALYRLLVKTQGLEQIILVSDAMRATGMEDGDYDLGGQTVHVCQGAARLPGGKLAGSIITLNQAVLNFQRSTTVSWAEALQLASGNPARMLKVEQQFGNLQPGAAADIALFDRNMCAQLTIVQGEIVYQRKTGGEKLCVLQ